MRRGRPTKAGDDPKAPQPSPSPLRGASNDPWMVLDSASTSAPDPAASKDASVRFPALDDFSLLHDSGSEFAFDPKAEPKKQPSRDISQRVTDALADDAFAQPKSTSMAITQLQPSPNPQSSGIKAKSTVHQKPEAIPSNTTQQPVTQRMGYVSTGTMTSPSPPSPTDQSTSMSSRPIFRFPPSSDRSSSQPRASDAAELAAATLRADAAGQKRHSFLDHRSRSQILTFDPPNSPQPSSEAGHRSSYLSALDSSVHRSKSANSKQPRPTSVQAPAKPNLLRRLSKERSNSRPIDDQNRELHNPSLLISTFTGEVDVGEETVRIDSNVDFLKAKEEEDASKRKEKRLSSGSRHIKRASMPSVSLSGTKNLLAGRFGDAFKRFETNASGDDLHDSSCSSVRGANELTPIAGSEATDGRSDDGNDLEESQEVPPEMRRELERRRLSQEEKRVTDAAAAYRQRLAEGGDGGRGRPIGGNNKAASIQSKVQSLLDESGRASPSPTKTAFGYGRFTDTPDQLVIRPPRTSSRQVPKQTPSNMASSQVPSRPKPASDIPPPHMPLANNQPSSINLPHHSAPLSERPFNRPPGGPPPKPQTKPQNLRTGERPPQSPAKPSSLATRKPVQQRLQQRLQQQQPPPPDILTNSTNDDWEVNFSRRYPDLAGLKMVETEIDSGASGTNTGQGREMRIRDV